MSGLIITLAYMSTQIHAQIVSHSRQSGLMFTRPEVDLYGLNLYVA